MTTNAALFCQKQVFFRADEMKLGDYLDKFSLEIKEGDSREDDGYVLFCSADAKESNWVSKSQMETFFNKSGSLTFGQAIDARKLGWNIGRAGVERFSGCDATIIVTAEDFNAEDWEIL